MSSDLDQSFDLTVIRRRSPLPPYRPVQSQRLMRKLVVRSKPPRHTGVSLLLRFPSNETETHQVAFETLRTVERNTGSRSGFPWQNRG